MFAFITPVRTDPGLDHVTRTLTNEREGKETFLRGVPDTVHHLHLGETVEPLHQGEAAGGVAEHTGFGVRETWLKSQLCHSLAVGPQTSE